MGVYSGTEKGSPEWGACPEWVREGREARLCGDSCYARAEVSQDVCRLHRYCVQSNSSAHCNDFNTGLVLPTDHHVNGPMELFRAFCYGTLESARRASVRIQGGDGIRYQRIRFRRYKRERDGAFTRGQSFSVFAPWLDIARFVRAISQRLQQILT